MEMPKIRTTVEIKKVELEKKGNFDNPFGHQMHVRYGVTEQQGGEADLLLKGERDANYSKSWARDVYFRFRREGDHVGKLEGVPSFPDYFTGVHSSLPAKEERAVARELKNVLHGTWKHDGQKLSREDARLLDELAHKAEDQGIGRGVLGVFRKAWHGVKNAVASTVEAPITDEILFEAELGVRPQA